MVRWEGPRGENVGPQREAFFFLLLRPVAHFGDRSWRDAKGELLDEEGDTPSILPGESAEDPTLLRLPSTISGEWLKWGEKMG